MQPFERLLYRRQLAALQRVQEEPGVFCFLSGDGIAGHRTLGRISHSLLRPCLARRSIALHRARAGVEDRAVCHRDPCPSVLAHLPHAAVVELHGSARQHALHVLGALHARFQPLRSRLPRAEREPRLLVELRRVDLPVLLHLETHRACAVRAVRSPRKPRAGLPHRVHRVERAPDEELRHHALRRLAERLRIPPLVRAGRRERLHPLLRRLHPGHHRAAPHRLQREPLYYLRPRQLLERLRERHVHLFPRTQHPEQRRLHSPFRQRRELLAPSSRSVGILRHFCIPLASHASRHDCLSDPRRLSRFHSLGTSRQCRSSLRRKPHSLHSEHALRERVYRAHRLLRPLDAFVHAVFRELVARHYRVHYLVVLVVPFL